MIKEFLKKLNKNSIYKVSGLPGGARAYFLLHLIEKVHDVLAVEENEDDAQILEDNMKALSEFFPGIRNERIVFFPQNDFWLISAALGAITGREKEGVALKNICVITTRDALARPLPEVENFSSSTLRVSLDGDVSRDHFIKKLVENNYNHANFVESKGEFALRGEIIDVWPPQAVNPYRIVLYESKVESVREFDVYTQRSEKLLREINIFPVVESGRGTLKDYIIKRKKGIVSFVYAAEGEATHVPGTKIIYDNLADSSTPDMGFNRIGNFNRDIERFSKQLMEWRKEGLDVHIFSHTTGEEERLKELIHARTCSMVEYPKWHTGNLAQGFINTPEKIVIVSNGEVFNRFQKPIRHLSFMPGRKLDAVSQLKSGDYVVHKTYGIGRYAGLKNIESFGSEGEYISLEYKNQDKLYVPIDDFALIQKYVGVEGKRPRVYSLDGFSWERAKLKVKKGVEEMAKSLLQTAALRALKKGYAFSDDTYLEKEFEHQFPYRETPDQARSIAEIKQDMISQKPMDRLLCGDVGYGKTEVALRATLKAVVASKQVGLLVPTTILAEQHYHTFSERFADFPVSVEMLSRFRTKHEQKKVIEGLKNGRIDVVIGTHRLLQKDVVFKDIGLFIIDEEHRFGVKAKENVKKIRENVDVITMTATPIPRTLYMGFAGVKDLSIIETPPEGRQPIMTHVGAFREDMIKKAFYLELNRKGQVFYVYNRVESIQSKMQYLRVLIPDVKFAYVHGQMKPSRIEETMYHFLKGDYDCLIATSIIESGLDIPRVNTLIVENAENLGLAQLYQLRGRVGRQDRQAYCYLFFSPGQGLTEEARKRLEALKEFTALGSGFKLALRDLEIRGAGNILGKQQHGFVNEVGFDFYAQLLKEEIEKQQGKSVPEPEETVPELHISVPAFFPENYISTDTERIFYYKRISRVKGESDIKNIKDELLDRFGRWGIEVENIFELLGLRLACRKLGVKSVVQQGKQLILGLLPENKLDAEKITSLAYREPDKIQFQDRKTVFIIKYNDFFSDNEGISAARNFLYKLV